MTVFPKDKDGNIIWAHENLLETYKVNANPQNIPFDHGGFLTTTPY